ncbi:Phi92_gp028 [Enterobacteria phage phi92] [Escherichia phage vB_Eco_PATM]|nr:Phi92_gp028 [Enterobacteria phage phi92] [Escherichia phage vB_Eco_PATM]
MVNIKTGDIVRLASEEMLMTVMISTYDTCEVVWFDVNEQLQKATFDKRMLRKVEEVKEEE